MPLHLQAETRQVVMRAVRPRAEAPARRPAGDVDVLQASGRRVEHGQGLEPPGPEAPSGRGEGADCEFPPRRGGHRELHREQHEVARRLGAHDEFLELVQWDRLVGGHVVLVPRGTAGEQREVLERGRFAQRVEEIGKRHSAPRGEARQPAEQPFRGLKGAIRGEGQGANWSAESEDAFRDREGRAEVPKRDSDGKGVYG